MAAVTARAKRTSGLALFVAGICIGLVGLQLCTTSFVQVAAPKDGEAMMARRGVLVATTIGAASSAGIAAVHAEAIEKENKWLTARATKEGVVALPSGLMYKVLQTGPAGGPSPGVGEQCDVTYAGQLTNGNQFDAGSLKFAPNQVISGWTEAMQLMKEGDKWELYIPSRLAYGEQGAGGAIPGGASLVFQMKINKVNPASSSPFSWLR